MVSDTEMNMLQKCGIEFLHVENTAPTDIHQCLLNAYGDQTVDVTALKIELCEQHFPSNDTVTEAVKQ